MPIASICVRGRTPRTRARPSPAAISAARSASRSGVRSFGGRFARSRARFAHCATRSARSRELRDRHSSPTRISRSIWLAAGPRRLPRARVVAAEDEAVDDRARLLGGAQRAASRRAARRAFRRGRARATPAAASRIESASSWSRRPPPAATTRPRVAVEDAVAPASPVTSPARRAPRVGDRGRAPADRVEDREGGEVGLDRLRRWRRSPCGGAMLSAIRCEPCASRSTGGRWRLLSTGHCAVDFAGGALPALLPFLQDRVRPLVHARGGAGARVGASRRRSSSRSSGSGRTARGDLAPAGRRRARRDRDGARRGRAARTGSSSCSWSSPGSGSAAYHPEGSKFAAYVSGRRRASGMSLFSIGGNVGYALGAARRRRRSCVALGLHGGLLLVVPVPRDRGAPARGYAVPARLRARRASRARASGRGGRPRRARHPARR